MDAIVAIIGVISVILLSVGIGYGLGHDRGEQDAAEIHDKPMHELSAAKDAIPGIYSYKHDDYDLVQKSPAELFNEAIRLRTHLRDHADNLEKLVERIDNALDGKEAEDE